MAEELATMDATAQAELVRAGEASPVELVDAAIERIEALNGDLNAVIHPLFERAREQAAGEIPDGPFRGVPIVHKDLGAHWADEPYHEGTKFLRDLGWKEQDETWLAARYRDAGFISCGKTNTPEFGILPTTEPEAYGPTANPWDTGHSSGGSSGGSGSAVAAGMVPLAHANDGGGSIRIPASECGLVGLKPSRARVTLGPQLGEPSSGLSVELALTRSVRDCAAILDAVHGPGPGDPYVAPPPERPYLEEVGAEVGELRIGVMTDAPAGAFEVHPDCVAAAESAGELLESLGHGVEASHPSALEDSDYVDRFIGRWVAIVAANLSYWSHRIGRELTADDVEPTTWALAEDGKGVSAVELMGILAYQQGSARRSGGVVGVGLRPPADADARRASAAAGAVRAEPRRPDRAAAARGPDRRVHRDLERDRTAGDLAAAALERPRAAGRRAARRPVRARGPAAAGRRPARGGEPVGRSHPRGVRRDARLTMINPATALLRVRGRGARMLRWFQA